MVQWGSESQTFENQKYSKNRLSEDQFSNTKQVRHQILIQSQMVGIILDAFLDFYPSKADLQKVCIYMESFQIPTVHESTISYLYPELLLLFCEYDGLGAAS